MSPHRSHHVDVYAGVDYIRQTNATPLHVETLLDCGDSRLARHVIECLRLVLVCELIVAFKFGGRLERVQLLLLHRGHESHI